MKQDIITLNGKQYPVVFDFQTILNFEDIAGHSIFEDNLNTMKSRIAIIMAAVISADENADLTIQDIMGSNDFEAVRQVIEAYAVIDKLAADFYKIPEVEKKADEAEKPEDSEQPKN